MNVLASFSPSLVLLAWAACEALGCRSVVLTVTGLALLALALGLHVRVEMERHHVL